MLGPGDQVDAGVFRPQQVAAPAEIGMDQRRPLLPILGRAVGLDDQRIGLTSREDRAGLARERVGRERIAKREPVLRVEAVLVLGSGAARHAEAVVGEHLARTRDMAQHAVEDAPPVPVVVHAEFEEMA